MSSPAFQHDVLLPSPETEIEALIQIARLRELAEALLARNAQLQAALGSRIVIEQAKGVLAERHDIGIAAAFELLRRAARGDQTSLRGLALEVVQERETPPSIQAQLAAR